MPVYKMDGKKDGKQKYRVRINYTDHFGKSHQIDRVAYGQSEGKQLERELNYKVKQELPSGSLTVGELGRDSVKKVGEFVHSLREALDK